MQLTAQLLLNSLGKIAQIFVEALAKYWPALAAYYTAIKTKQAAERLGTIEEALKAKRIADAVDRMSDDEFDRLRNDLNGK